MKTKTHIQRLAEEAVSQTIEHCREIMSFVSLSNSNRVKIFKEALRAERKNKNRSTLKQHIMNELKRMKNRRKYSMMGIEGI